MFNQALYPVEYINWCIYALFINDHDRIRKDCFLKTLNRTTNLAYTLDVGTFGQLVPLQQKNYKLDVSWRHI